MAKITLNNLWENRDEVLRRCKVKHACIKEFTRLNNAGNANKFKQVILDNFNWVNCKDIIDTTPFMLADDFSEGLASVGIKTGKWKYIKPDGKFVGKATYRLAFDFSEGVAMVKKGNKYGFIYPDGKWFIRPKFDDAWGFSNGIATVKIKGEWYDLQRDGVIVK